MQKTESIHDDIALLYEGLVEMVSHSETTPDITLSVLSKVLVLLALASGRDKEQFLAQMEHVWEFENFFQPDSSEKH